MTKLSAKKHNDAEQNSAHLCKIHTKITVNGKQFVLYGEAVTGNIYNTANKVLEDTTANADTKEAAAEIVSDYINLVG